MNPIRYLENRIRGWLPKEPSVPSNQRTKMVEIVEKDKQRKIFKISSVANAIMLSTFLSIHFFTNPNVWTFNLTVISWIIFTLSLISVNFLLYRNSKSKTKNQMEDLKS